MRAGARVRRFAQDDMFLRMTVSYRLFTKASIPFDVACNGAEAVEMAMAAGPDGQPHLERYCLIVMDNQASAARHGTRWRSAAFSRRSNRPPAARPRAGPRPRAGRALRSALGRCQ